MGANYHIYGENNPVKWETSDDGKTGWQTVGEGDNAFFGFGKYYRGTVEIEAVGAPFSEVIQTLVNGIDTDDVDYMSVDLDEETGRLVVSRIFEPITSYKTQYETLKAWFENETADDDLTKSAKNIVDAFTAGNNEGKYTKNSWNRFENAYNHVRYHLAVEINQSAKGMEAPGGLRPNDFANGKAALIAAYEGLVSDAEELVLQHEVTISVAEPENGNNPEPAELTIGGSVETKPESVQPIKGDLNYSIGAENELIGNIQFPESTTGENEETVALDGNKIFNVSGTNQFIMSFDIYVPERLEANRTESIIGKFDQQYALQINRDNIYLFGHLSGGWHQVNCSVSSDAWYGTWHNCDIQWQ